ncbi:hypothetical protein NOV72_04495 [Caballeronia novacaledonica]|uniref:Uncharacterized protein n=1 Tax=Caballeronia novacaledonica TaxID=1544861 RepID=A0A2U3IAS0_9BURK|nr:hypothetical protein [Caballeronia novacaledonica]SPB17291.1 hypothetical protein NOV72_04495 [Caballeronia novacaledonica]
MTTLPVPCGHLTVASDLRENGDGRRRASAAVMRGPFGRALQSDHADAFDTNAFDVPTDFAVVEARVGPPAAPTRG